MTSTFVTPAGAVQVDVDLITSVNSLLGVPPVLGAGNTVTLML
jgi:hypothetical protein